MSLSSKISMAVFVVCIAASPALAGGEAAKAPNGKPVFSKFKCNSCHTIESQAIVKKADPTEKDEETGRKPPDLSGVGVKRSAAWIEGYLLKKEMIETRKHMKKFRGTDAELKTLAGWLESLKDEKAAAKLEQSEKAK